jgi:hypothetical protein
VRLVPLMIKLGAVNEPMLPRKFARNPRYEAHVCTSAGGMSAGAGMYGFFVLLDMGAAADMSLPDILRRDPCSGSAFPSVCTLL